MARSTTRVLAALTAALLALVTAVVAAAPASAEAFRYWGYYAADGTAWTFAQAGPADTVPADGAVEGWRFAVADEASTRYPRATPDFETLCGAATAEDGQKRVGVVIDYGTTDDAPDADTTPAARGACAVVDTDASGADVLAAVAELRLGDGGFVCGIDGYPTQGCGDAVDAAAPSGDEEPVELELAGSAAEGGSTSWVAIVLGVAAIAVVAIAALVVSRRHSGDASGDASGA